jgi:hypothetical protein
MPTIFPTPSLTPDTLLRCGDGRAHGNVRLPALSQADDLAIDVNNIFNGSAVTTRRMVAANKRYQDQTAIDGRHGPAAVMETME